VSGRRSPNGPPASRETRTYDPGQSGRCDELDDVIDEPADPAFVATALRLGRRRDRLRIRHHHRRGHAAGLPPPGALPGPERHRCLRRRTPVLIRRIEQARGCSYGSASPAKPAPHGSLARISTQRNRARKSALALLIHAGLAWCGVPDVGKCS
jgi:hypothetical protein